MIGNNAINTQENNLNEHRICLLKKSFRKMNVFRVARNFYSKLFEQYPETKILFTSDVVVQTEKLISVLELVIFSFEVKNNFSYGLEDTMIIPLRNLGRQLEEIEVKAEHYSVASALLLEAIEEEIGLLFCDDLRMGWEVVLNQMSAAMLDSSVDQGISKESPTKSYFNRIVDGIRKRVKLICAPLSCQAPDLLENLNNSHSSPLFS